MIFRFSYLVGFTALLIASCAAYYSIFGLSQLFAGASTAVIIMGSALEFGKVIVTSLLHRYWGKISTSLKIYLSICIFVLVCITSAGIYGFLSNAYQKTASKLEIHDGKIQVLNEKKLIFEKNIADNEKNINNKTKRIDLLTNLRTNQETRLDSAKSARARINVRLDIDEANKEIQKLTSETNIILAKNESLSDSLSFYSNKILTIKSSSNIAAEIGPLKYLSELTGYPMDLVVNYFILLLVFVFDPLAVALVIATNRLFELESDKKKDDIKSTTPIITNDNTIVEELNSQKEESIINELEKYTIESEQESVSDIIETKIEPVITTGKVAREDIKEIKEINRGFSVDVPKNKTQVDRIGTNKLIKGGDNNRIFFRRNQ